MDNEIKLKRRPAYEIVLNAFKEGLEITLEDTRFCFINETLCMKFDLFENTRYMGEKRIIADIPFNKFMNLCSNLTEDELITISANTALTKINREKRS